MSKYTTEVRFICEAECGYAESQGGKKVNDIITEAAPKIFDFSFPIFDEAYRLPLEVKILRHFYTREICEETVALWKLRLEDKLNVIMPYYNKLYNSELLEFNPLYDVDYQREHTRDYEGNENRKENRTDTTTGNVTREKGATGETNSTENMTDTAVKDRDVSGSTSVNETVNTTGSENGSASKDGGEETHATGTSENTHWDLYSDTPQGGVEGIARATDDIVNNAYLTNARKVTDSGSTSDNGTRSYNEDSTSTLSSTGSETTAGTTTSTTEEDETITDTRATAGNVTTENNENETIEQTSTLTGSATNVNDITNTEEYTEHVFGKQGGITYSKMLEEFRATFLNIDRMILRDLSDLFFGLWA